MSTPAPFVVGDLSALVLPSDRYTVLAASQSQMLSGTDDLVDSVEIVFMVTGRPGTYSVELPIVGWRVFENGLDLTSEANIIEQLWSL